MRTRGKFKRHDRDDVKKSHCEGGRKKLAQKRLLKKERRLRKNFVSYSHSAKKKENCGTRSKRGFVRKKKKVVH